MSRKVLARSASDRTPAEVASDTDCELQNRRNHNDAFGLAQQVLRNPVRNVHNFLEYLTARFQSLLLPAVTRAEGRTRHKNGCDKSTNFSHRLLQRISLIVAPPPGNNNGPVFALVLRRNSSLSGAGVDNTTHSRWSQLVVALSFQLVSKLGAFGSGENNASDKMDCGLCVGGVFAHQQFRTSPRPRKRARKGAR